MYFKGFVILMTLELVFSYPYRTLNDVEYNRRYIPKLLNAKDEDISEKPAKYSAQHFDQDQQYVFMNDYNKALTEEQLFGSDSLKPQAQQHFSYDMDLNRDVDERQYHGYESFMNPSQLKSNERNYKNDQSQRHPSDRVSFRYPTRNEYYGNDDKKVLTQQYLEQAQQRSFDSSPSQAQSVSEQYFRYPTQQKFTDSNSLKQQVQKQQAFDMDLSRDFDERQYRGYQSFKNPSQLKSDEGSYKNDQSQRQLLAEESFKYAAPKEALNMDLNKVQDLRKYHSSSSVHQDLIEPQKQFLPEESFGYSSQNPKMNPSLLQNEQQKYAFAKDLTKNSDQKQFNIESSGKQVLQKEYQQGSDESYKYQTKIYPESSWYSAQEMKDRMKKSHINQTPKISVTRENNDLNVVSEQKKIENSFSTNNKKNPPLSESFISPAYMQLDSLDMFNSLAQQNSGILSSIPEKSINKIQHPSYRTQVKQQQDHVQVYQQPQQSTVHQQHQQSSVNQQPQQSSVHQQPQQSTVHQQHQQSSVNQQPQQSSVHQQLQQSPVQQQPQHSPVQQQPQHSPVQQQPQHSLVQQQLQHVPIHQQPQHSPVHQQPQHVPVHQQPQHSPVHQQPQHVPVHQQSQHNPVQQQPHQSSVHQQPQQSSVYQQPQQSSVHQQPLHSSVQHPSYSTQVKQQPDYAPVYQYPSYSTNVQQQSQHGAIHHQPQYSSVQHPSYSTQVQKHSNHVPTHQPNAYNISAYLFFPNNAYITKA